MRRWCFLLLFPVGLWGQVNDKTDYIREGRGPFTEQARMYGSLNPQRAFQMLAVEMSIRPPLTPTETLYGSVSLKCLATGSLQRLQLDLTENWRVAEVWAKLPEVSTNDSLKGVPFQHQARQLMVFLPRALAAGDTFTLRVRYAGKPQVATNPPWDGGFVFSEDGNGKPWVAVACEGLGASSWWPLRDHPSDEADLFTMHIVAPDSLAAVGNGLFRGKIPLGTAGTEGRIAPPVKGFDNPAGWSGVPISSSTVWTWDVSYPINAYNVTLYVGDYIELPHRFSGAEGEFPMNFWVLRANVEMDDYLLRSSARMLGIFEQLFGPYPYFRDGYKLVEAPYWGMEHQSAIAYGNKYQLNEWRFDYIIIHESGHEWFGNHISASDHADLWIHESFTTYAEALYVEYRWDYAHAARYLNSQRPRIQNLDAIQGPRGVGFNDWASSDMYFKGSWMLHTLRQAMNNDEKWLEMFKLLNQDFAHQTVQTEQVVAWFSNYWGKDLSLFFDLYLNYPYVPRIEYRLTKKGKGSLLEYRWRNAKDGLRIEVPVTIGTENLRLAPTDAVQELALPNLKVSAATLDGRGVLVDFRAVENF